MSGRLFLLTDLDDTLFHSERKRPEGVAGTAAAVNAHGAPISYQCPRQQRLWTALSSIADVVVPVTGRTSYALERVGILPPRSVAVVSHGALVINAGELHPLWRDRLAAEIPGALGQLEKAHADLVSRFSAGGQPPLTFRVLEDLSVPVYLSIKGKGDMPLDATVQQALAEVARVNDLTLHLNERNAALRPRYTRKDEACRFVLERILQRQPEDTVITFGDSLSDMPFMGGGDVAMTPTNSQIWNSIKELAQ